LAQEQPGQTLQATALVHEAYVRLVDSGQRPVPAPPRPLLRPTGTQAAGSHNPTAGVEPLAGWGYDCGGPPDYISGAPP
jgi:hypothetical protein